MSSSRSTNERKISDGLSNGCGALNEDLWASIMYLLPTRDLLTSVSLVCRLWKELAREATSKIMIVHARLPRFARREEWQAFKRRVEETVYSSVISRKSSLQVLALNTNETVFDWTRLIKDLETYPKLEILDMVSSDYETFEDWDTHRSCGKAITRFYFEELPVSLRILRVSRFENKDPQIYSRLTDLRVLHVVTNLNWSSAAQHLCQLVILTIKSSLDHWDLEHISCIKTLMYLDITIVDSDGPIKTRTIELLLNLPKLRHLNLTVNKLECDLSILRRHPTLEQIKFHGYVFNHIGWASLFKLPQLQSLEVYQFCKYCEGTDDYRPHEIMAPPADLQSCGLQYLTVQAYHVATKYDILAFLDAPALKSISIYARFELDLEKLPNLQAFTSKRQDCTIEIKSGKPFSQEVETVLKEIGFSLSSALDGPLIHIASFVPPNTLHENPSSQMSFFDDVLMKQLGEDCQICSDKKLYSRYLEFLSQCSKWVGMT